MKQVQGGVTKQVVKRRRVPAGGKVQEEGFQQVKTSARRTDTIGEISVSRRVPASGTSARRRVPAGEIHKQMGPSG